MVKIFDEKLFHFIKGYIIWNEYTPFTDILFKTFKPNWSNLQITIILKYQYISDTITTDLFIYTFKYTYSYKVGEKNKIK